MIWGSASETELRPTSGEERQWSGKSINDVTAPVPHPVTEDAASIPLLRYLELAVGYGTRGFGKGPGAVDDRARNVYWGMGLNLAELLDGTVFRGEWRHGRTQGFADGVLEYVQVPGTVLLEGERLSRE